MLYNDLHQLIQCSNSSRAYFLSLEPCLQMALHAQGETIHTQAQLRLAADTLQRYQHHIAMSERFQNLWTQNKRGRS